MHNLLIEHKEKWMDVDGMDDWRIRSCMFHGVGIVCSVLETSSLTTDNTFEVKDTIHSIVHKERGERGREVSGMGDVAPSPRSLRTSCSHRLHLGVMDRHHRNQNNGTNDVQNLQGHCR